MSCIFCKDWTDRTNCGHVLLGETLLPAQYATRRWTLAGEISTRALNNADLENSRHASDHLERQCRRAGHGV